MAETNHTARKHALLSASGASRWLHCTPSARLEEKFQESAPSVHAEEGTLAHELSDVQLRYLNGEISLQSRKKELTKIAKRLADLEARIAVETKSASRALLDTEAEFVVPETLTKLEVELRITRASQAELERQRDAIQGQLAGMPDAVRKARDHFIFMENDGSLREPRPDLPDPDDLNNPTNRPGR